MPWCPKCHEGKESGTIFCAACGTELIIDATCPQCGKKYEDGNFFCKIDGAKLVSAANLIPTCIKCGKKFEEGTKFCPDDGGKVTPKYLHSSGKDVFSYICDKKIFDKKIEDTNFKWYFEVLKKYAVFTGRAGRKEYWYFVLFNLIIFVVLAVLDVLFRSPGILKLAYNLAVLIPGIAVGVRRLHDTDRSGWWLLLGLIPIIGAIVLIIFFAQDGNPRDNQYGPNPKDATG